MDTIVKRPTQMLLFALALATACLDATQAEVKKVCMGEVISNQSIRDSSGGAFDSAVGEGADECWFLANSAVGRQIDKVCRLRDTNATDEPGSTCSIEAMVQKKAIRRVIAIKSIEASPIPQKPAPSGALCE